MIFVSHSTIQRSAAWNSGDCHLYDDRLILSCIRDFGLASDLSGQPVMNGPTLRAQLFLCPSIISSHG
jgi:hypothetical protein